MQCGTSHLQTVQENISHVYTATNREGTARQKSWQCKRVERAWPGATFWWAEPNMKR